MLKDAYDSLAKAIESAGFYTNGLESRGSWQRTTVCSKRTSDGKLTGNSFWVTLLPTGSYVGVWNGNIYKLTDANRIDELCIAWLIYRPNETQSDFDDVTKKRFGLTLVSEREFDQEVSKSSH